MSIFRLSQSKWAIIGQSACRVSFLWPKQWTLQAGSTVDHNSNLRVICIALSSLALFLGDPDLAQMNVPNSAAVLEIYTWNHANRRRPQKTLDLSWGVRRVSTSKRAKESRPSRRVEGWKRSRVRHCKRSWVRNPTLYRRGRQIVQRVSLNVSISIVNGAGSRTTCKINY